jgi:hypothetical protein
LINHATTPFPTSSRHHRLKVQPRFVGR